MCKKYKLKSFKSQIPKRMIDKHPKHPKYEWPRAEVLKRKREEQTFDIKSNGQTAKQTVCSVG